MEIPSSLINIAEKVGNDITLVQGPGGNISYKNKETMIIKASGKKMSDARKRNIFVETNHKKIISAIENNEADPIKNSWKEDSLMRPSIETTMHALMPHPYVLHVHCVNTLSWIVQKNYQNNLNIYLEDYNWISIPYRKPGLSLTNELKEPIKKSKANVILLSNHGIIAGSDSAKNVFDIIKSISKKLFTGEREKKKVYLKKLEKYLSCNKYKLPKYEYLHQIAYSFDHSKIATQGTIFPDQVVFLPNGIKNINTFEELIELVNNRGDNIPVVIINNIGVLVPNNSTEVSEDILLGLFMTILRIPTNTSINYLTESDISDLINWDMEKHRQMLNK